ncbi:hypothetical protein PR048_021007 [Dryococelus australis]|uniref:Uncharacterized protein n=1 Tax=Dryococelus australis TaxID=614101 RepID=A0ABQ9GX18_9NEOP|nr:hypothetical protein PR048_021007 [Dryococelus australis]
MGTHLPVAHSTSLILAVADFSLAGYFRRQSLLFSLVVSRLMPEHPTLINSQLGDPSHLIWKLRLLTRVPLFTEDAYESLASGVWSSGLRVTLPHDTTDVQKGLGRSVTDPEFRYADDMAGIHVLVGRAQRSLSRQFSRAGSLDAAPGDSVPASPAPGRGRSHLLRRQSQPPPESDGGSVSERLACSLPTKTNRAQSLPRSPDFRKWVVPDDAIGRQVFSRITHFTRPFILVPLTFTFITLVGSQDLAVSTCPHLSEDRGHSYSWLANFYTQDFSYFFYNMPEATSSRSAKATAYYKCESPGRLRLVGDQSTARTKSGANKKKRKIGLDIRPTVVGLQILRPEVGGASRERDDGNNRLGVLREGGEDFRGSSLFSQSHAVNQRELGAPLLSHKDGFLEYDLATKTGTSNSTVNRIGREKSWHASPLILPRSRLGTDRSLTEQQASGPAFYHFYDMWSSMDIVIVGKCTLVTLGITFPCICKRPSSSIALHITESAVTDVYGVADSTARSARACRPPWLGLPRFTTLCHARVVLVGLPALGPPMDEILLQAGVHPPAEVPVAAPPEMLPPLDEVPQQADVLLLCGNPLPAEIHPMAVVIIFAGFPLPAEVFPLIDVPPMADEIPLMAEVLPLAVVHRLMLLVDDSLHHWDSFQLQDEQEHYLFLSFLLWVGEELWYILTLGALALEEVRPVGDGRNLSSWAAYWYHGRDVDSRPNCLAVVSPLLIEPRGWLLSPIVPFLIKATDDELRIRMGPLTTCWEHRLYTADLKDHSYICSLPINIYASETQCASTSTSCPVVNSCFRDFLTYLLLFSVTRINFLLVNSSSSSFFSSSVSSLSGEVLQ